MMIGETLSQYKVLSKLGAGGMGEVYLAEDNNLKRKVALKVMPPELADKPERLLRFKREAEAVAALNHPNIVTIHNIEEIGGRRILIMEFVEGDSLEQLLRPEGLPLSEAFAVAVPLTNALVAAHDKGIVHRDLKPANIMIRPDGQVKVLDFGLAKFTSEAAGTFGEDEETQARAAMLTREGTVMGTAPYMSPEQLRGKAIDRRSDIFSLGILLYEMVTGERPFQGDSHIELASRILRDTPTSVTEVRADLPEDLGRIIHTCLEKDPERRYQSVKDVRNELEQLKDDLQSQAASSPRQAAVGSGPVLSSGPLQEPSGQGKGLWIAMTGVALVLVVLGGWWFQRGAQKAATGATSDGTAESQPAADSSPEELGPASSDKIAVLPFATRGTAEETGSFADGVHDDLLTTLTSISGLKVISRTSVLQYRDTTKNLRQIGRELGAANLLEGGVQQIGNQVRINVQLIDATTDEHIWAETYDRELSVTNLFDIQSEIAQTIAQALDVTLLTEERERIRRDPTDNLEAFYAYNRGKQLFVRSTFESLRAAEIEFKQALEIDPDYVLANIALARTHSMLASTGATTIEDMLREGRPFIDRAIAVDADNAYALAVLARYQFTAGESDYEATFQRAVERGPNVVEVLDIYSSFLRGRQRMAEAIVVIRQALELDPLSTSLYHDLGRASIGVGDFDEATTAFQRIAQIDPHNPYATHGSALATILGGRLAEAAHWSDKTSTYDPADYENQATSTLIYMSAGNVEMARKRSAEALALGPEEPYPLAAKAYLLTVTNERAAAVRLARTALAKQLDDRWRSEFIFLRVIRDEAIASGEFQEALAWYRQLTPELFADELRVEVENVQKAVDLAHLLQLTGNAQRAENLLLAAIETYDQRYAVGAANYPLGVAKAEALALLDRRDEAIRALRHAFDDGWRLLWRWDTVNNRNFDRVRDSSEFKAIVESIEADLAEQVATFKGGAPLS